MGSVGRLGEWGLHPLIHTLLEFALAQDVDCYQRFCSLVSELPQRGTFFHSASFLFSLDLIKKSEYTCLIVKKWRVRPHQLGAVVR